MSFRLPVQRLQGVKKVKSMLDLFRYWIRAFSGRRPRLFYALYSLSPRNRGSMVGKDTELVIEGFPRSANTFAVVAFQYAQEREVRLAHHLHAQAQVLRGVELGVPVCLLIREPVSAVKSMVVRHPHIPVRMALKSYIDFYTDISALRENCVIATFEDVTNEFGAVTEKINEKFNTDFASFEPTDATVEEVISLVEGVNTQVTGSVEEYESRPSDKKESLKRKVSTEGSEDLAKKAYEIYEMYLRDAKAGS